MVAETNAPTPQLVGRRNLLKKAFVAATIVTVPALMVTRAGAATLTAADGGLVVEPAASPNEAFELTTRSKLGQLPVVTLRPTTANTGLSLDLMPNGTCGTFFGNGNTWLDVCDADVLSADGGTVGTARVGVFPTSVEFGTRLYNGATPKDVNFSINGTPILTIGGGQGVPLGTVIQQRKSSGLTQFLVDNPQSQADNGGNAGSYASVMVTTDTGGLSLQAYSSTYASDGGHFSSAGGLCSNGVGGMTVTASAAAPIRFVTGGWQVSTNQRMMIDGEGNVGVGLKPDFAGGAGVVYLAKATALPTTTPAAGGVLFVDGVGRLNYRGPLGGTTIIAGA